MSYKKQKGTQLKKSKKSTKTIKLIRKVKMAVATRPANKSKVPKKVAKKIDKKRKLATKKEVIVKEIPKPELSILTTEEMQKVSDILSRPLIRQSLVDMGGENAIAIIRNFDRNSSDDDIAKKLKLKISDVRAALNRLHNEGLVLYNRSKDNETGWYSYSWYLNKNRVERWADERAKKFDATNPGNSDEFYVCPFCGVSTITGFDEAMTKAFKCDICGKQMEFLDEDKMQKLGIVQTKTFVRTVR
ncbi:MAG: hypothetical protein V1492_02735 [Candidatus Micrarchaeota archaeon]